MTELSVSSDGTPNASATEHPSTVRPFRKRWLLAWVLVGGVVGAGIYSLAPKVYRARAVIQVVPPRIPPDLINWNSTANLDTRLANMIPRVFSRTRLESLIGEFNLYPNERRTELMEDVTEMLNRDIDISIVRGNAFQVSYESDDRATAFRVTARLAQLLIDDSLQYREVFTRGSQQFLESEAEETRSRLAEYDSTLREWAAKHPHQPAPQAVLIENEILQESYKTLLRSNFQSQMQAALETRQMGEQFRLVEPARAPEKPIGPLLWPFLTMGAVLGIAVGLLFRWVLRLDQSRWRRRMQGTAPA